MLPLRSGVVGLSAVREAPPFEEPSALSRMRKCCVALPQQVFLGIDVMYNAEYNRRYYRDHRVSCKTRNTRRYRLQKAFLNWLKDQPCVDCGDIFPPYCMDFDHRDPSSKKFCIGMSAVRNMASLQAEIMKCDLVCANCHRKRTFGPIDK